MLALLKRLLVPVAIAVLVGCGGNDIKNPAHVRFFNGFGDRGDARLYIGGNLFSTPSVGPAISYGNELSYGRASSGSVDIVANPYGDPSTTWASLTSQALIKGVNYTVIGTTASGTRKLVLFEDGVAPSSGTAFVRLLNAAGTLTPVYYTIRRESDDSIVYQTTTTGQAVGTSSGYKSVSVPSTDGVTYLVKVYTSSTFTTSISDDIPVTLQEGTPMTVVLYNSADGRVHGRTGADAAIGG